MPECDSVAYGPFFVCGKGEDKHNTNVLIVGGAGAGKTRTYAVPNVLESGRLTVGKGALCTGCSMVITDPKGEILRKTGGFLKRVGYEEVQP